MKEIDMNKPQLKQQKKTKPVKGLLDSNFQYKNSSSTNVQETWKRFGWVPPSQKAPVNA